MPSPKNYERFELDEKSIKKYWTSKGENEKRKKLIELLSGTAHDGIDSGLRDHAIWWAIDLAYDAPFNQITPTIVRDVMRRSQGKKPADVLDILKSWNINLGDLVRETTGPDGCVITVIDASFMTQVVVPLVKAYVTIRRAKLFNDRNIFPLFKYEPIKFTLQNRIIGEIVTDIVQQISQQFGYPAVLRQAILQALQYGTCLMFPMEEWFCDMQIEGDSKEAECVREGLRYTMPHPTRYFFDHNHRISTLNTDSGCEFAGYWSVDRMGAIADNEHYFNTDKIAWSKSSNFGTNYRQYFSEIFPCKMDFPSNMGAAGAGVADREKTVEYYSSNDRDKAVFKTTIFRKIIPKDYGLGNYPHPIWMRFVVAGDDTVIWNAPIAYCPAVYFGYDADELRSRTAPMSLEVLPYQDIFSMTLTQHIFSTKQNLSKAVFVDTDQVDEKYLKQLELMGDARFSKIPFIPFSGRDARVKGQDRGVAFHNINFPLQDTSSTAQLMTQILTILDRVMVMSSQEVGQAATHEQTAEETRIIATNTSTRVTFTGSYIDDGIDAWKRQLYNASRAYLDDDVVAQVSVNVEGSKAALKKLGFAVVDESGTETNGQNKAVVKAKMSELVLDAFISTREGEARINGAAIAGAMSNLLQVAFSNPITAQAIGPQQSLDLITEIGKLAGMPKEFALKMAKGASPEEQQKVAQEGLQQIQQQITEQAVKAAEQAIGEPLAEQLGKTNEAVATVAQDVDQTQQSLAALIQQLGPIIEAMNQAQQAPPPPQYDTAPQEPALV